MEGLARKRQLGAARIEVVTRLTAVDGRCLAVFNSRPRRPSFWLWIVVARPPCVDHIGLRADVYQTPRQ